LLKLYDRMEDTVTSRNDYQTWRLPTIAGAVVFAAAAGLGTYSHSAAPTQARTFATAAEAATAFVDAARKHDAKALESLLGPDAQDLIESGDPVQDQAAMDKFVEAYDMKSALVQDSAGSTSWHVGADDWTLPIPIVLKDGRWQFDADTGYEEIINRRIGGNESNAIEASLAYVDAQREYASVQGSGNGFHEYAQRFVSSPGKQDGLYWPVQAGEPPSPLGEFFAEASAEGYLKQSANTQKKTTADPAASANPYYGYYYRILTSQGPEAPGGASDYIVNGKMIGGFALVAFPAEYGASGIMTFVVNYEGTVYQKDLGPETESIAGKITAYDPDSTWMKAQLPAPN
jgi:Protein of unknown function (DUF2950)